MFSQKQKIKEEKSLKRFLIKKQVKLDFDFLTYLFVLF
jgi:hypothetical protein